MFMYMCVYDYVHNATLVVLRFIRVTYRMLDLEWWTGGYSGILLHSGLLF